MDSSHPGEILPQRRWQFTKELLIWGKTSQLGQTSHPAFIWENIVEWDTFHLSQPACLVLSSYVTFFMSLFFCFYFNFELLINIHSAKFHKVNCAFYVIVIKTQRVSTKWTILSKWDSLAKTVYMEKNCPTSVRSHLLEVRSHLSEIMVGWIHSHIKDLFLESEVHHFAGISVRWDISIRWDVSLHTSSP